MFVAFNQAIHTDAETVCKCFLGGSSKCATTFWAEKTGATSDGGQRKLDTQTSRMEIVVGFLLWRYRNIYLT